MNLPSMKIRNIQKQAHFLLSNPSSNHSKKAGESTDPRKSSKNSSRKTSLTIHKGTTSTKPNSIPIAEPKATGKKNDQKANKTTQLLQKTKIIQTNRLN